ncbi:DNA-directed RNA polymerase sigma-70 factor [Chitiniphilus shinanonensis]|uniref:DNA-directed RNA polymerase sigma-70 factor n=1 Tax=Chitiniphilus shinanonensis TaxID=553088 RepID=A0ABQ6C291_9NEIS|nr:sigma-70 family RNA polymerase sigma factor [Chitiniphilus shinanonensis]GLS06273.1 DNA-directed RNA polymerase sigma-70 factor [Chitiniphilus shinanonensis]
MLVELPQPTLEAVFLAHRAQLLGLARKVVGTVETAEEIVHEAYLKLVEGACAREVRNPLGYCCQVVRNLALDHLRHQAVEATYRVYTDDGELPQVAGGTTPDQGIDERRVLDAIDRVLATLPPRTRLAFELYRLAGLTQRDIARQLGCSATLVNFMLRDVANALAGCRHLLHDD